jgi:hypothetical protein
MFKCPKCGRETEITDRPCVHCGQVFSPAMPAQPAESLRHRVLVWAIILAVLIGVMLLAAVSSVSAPRRWSFETNAIGSCRAYAEAQIMYKRQDWDGDGKLTYAASFPLLNTTPDASGSPIQFLDSAFAAATSPAAPKHGYYFGDMRTIAGKPIDWEQDFALCATPAVYGRTGFRTFIIKTDGTTWGKDLGSSGFVDDYPADPSAEGWIIAE